MEYRDFIENLNNAVSNFNDPNTNEIIHRANELLGEERPASSALFVYNIGLKQLFEIALGFCGYDLNSLGIELEQDSFCIILDYAEHVQLYAVVDNGLKKYSSEMENNSNAAIELVVMLPCVSLKEKRLVICSNINKIEDQKRIIEEQDSVCLIVSAIAAMSINEKNFLENLTARYYDSDRLFVYITNMDKLSDGEELSDIMNSVNIVLNRSGLDTKVFVHLDELRIAVKNTLNDSDRIAIAEKMIVRNCLIDVKKRLMTLSSVKSVDADYFEETIAQLEHQKKRLESSARVFTDVVMKNALCEMINEIREAAENYSIQVESRVADKIENTPDKELENIINDVNTYISKCWNKFTDTVACYAEQNNKELISKLVKQVELDIGEMYSEIDDSAVKIIYDSGIAENFRYDDLNIKDDDRSIVEKAKKNTVNVVLLSIPCAVINPLFGTAAFVGLLLAGKHKEKESYAQYRKQLVSEFHAVCRKCCEQIEDMIESSLVESGNKSARNIIKMYYDIVDKLISDISYYRESQQRINEMNASIYDICNKVIPEMLSQL